MAVINNAVISALDFVAYQGNTFDPEVTFSDAAGAPLDFAGATVKMDIVNEHGQLLKSLTNNGGFTVAANKITFNSLMDIEPGTHYYDMLVVYSDGRRKTPIGGRFIVQKSKTVSP